MRSSDPNDGRARAHALAALMVLAVGLWLLTYWMGPR